MATVELATRAVADLERLSRALSLPGDTRARLRACLAPLAEFPRLGAPLSGRWTPLRFVLGPWRWMLIVYEYIESEERVVVVMIQDARTSSAVTSG